MEVCGQPRGFWRVWAGVCKWRIFESQELNKIVNIAKQINTGPKSGCTLGQSKSSNGRQCWHTNIGPIYSTLRDIGRLSAVATDFANIY